MQIWLSEDWPAKYYPPGCRAVAVIVCISGSVMCLVTTGIPYSHTKSFLSSAQLTNLFSSIKSIVLMVPVCWLYSKALVPVLRSNWSIFLLLDPTKNEFCRVGWNLEVKGILFNLKVLKTKLLNKNYLFLSQCPSNALVRQRPNWGNVFHHWWIECL